MSPNFGAKSGEEASQLARDLSSRQLAGNVCDPVAGIEVCSPEETKMLPKMRFTASPHHIYMK